MLADCAPSSQPTGWRQALREAVSSTAELAGLLDIEPARLPGTGGMPIRVPRGFVARMRPGDPDDPLLRQVLPAPGAGDWPDDPVGDTAAQAVPGIIHKYHGRVLLIATGACAIHCQYCFRQHFPYAGASVMRDRWESAIRYLRGHPEVSEVILSGGDPLLLSDRRLRAFTDRLRELPSIRRLRLHSRVPVVLPERIDDGLLRWLDTVALPRILVIHANHPRELDTRVAAGLRALAEHGVTLLNQTVLLSGVNDDADVLTELSERLFAVGVLPYYLHRLDRVRGAEGFEVEEQRMQALMHRLRARLPGYLVPRPVREDAGAAYKTPLL